MTRNGRPTMDATMRAQIRTDPEAGGPRDPNLPPVQHARRAPLVSADAVVVEEVAGRLVFTLTGHGVTQLARVLHTTPEIVRRDALRTGWQVEA